jgi:hypothetical protein
MNRAWILCLLLASTACASCQQQARVTHVVVCWLKTPGDEYARQRLIDESKGLQAIPGLVSVSAGRPLPSTRPVVDTSYDVAIVMKFKDERALDTYARHPKHLEAVEKTLKPLVAKYVIYDFVEQ